MHWIKTTKIPVTLFAGDCPLFGRTVCAARQGEQAAFEEILFSLSRHLIIHANSIKMTLMGMLQRSSGHIDNRTLSGCADQFNDFMPDVGRAAPGTLHLEFLLLAAELNR